MGLDAKPLKTLLVSRRADGRDGAPAKRSVVSKRKLAYHRQARRQDLDAPIGEEFGSHYGEARSAGMRRGEKEDEMGAEILIAAVCVLASIWIIVLWGSRYFGPK